MADMTREKTRELTREEAIARVSDILKWKYECGIYDVALRFARSDMESVEELETEVEALKTDLWFYQNGYQAIDTKYKRLKDCLNKIKDTCLVSPSVIFPSDILDTINEYLGEVGE